MSTAAGGEAVRQGVFVHVGGSNQPLLGAVAVREEAQRPPRQFLSPAPAPSTPTSTNRVYDVLHALQPKHVGDAYRVDLLGKVQVAIRALAKVVHLQFMGAQGGKNKWLAR